MLTRDRAEGAAAAPGAEVGVIGSMLIDDRTVPILMQQLRAGDFSSGELRHVFEAIRAIFLRRGAVDPVTVLDELGSAGYRGLLQSCMDQTPTAANCEAYARIVRDQRQLREIQQACMEIVSADTDLARARELLAHAAGLLAARPGDRDRSYSELLADLLRRQADKTPPDHLDWGIPALNEKLQLGLGRFVILGADSSVGKTALALQFAIAIANAGKRVGFFSYETTLEDAADRMAANDADVSLGRTKAKRLGKEEIERIVAAGARSAEHTLRVMESARYTVQDIRAKCIAHGLQVIFIDYVQLIPTRRAERYEAVTEISIGLHALAQELGITVVGLSQVTVPETDKKGNRRYISKDDLRESRQLKQDADVIMLLDLADPKDRGSSRVLQIEKNRDGPLAHIVLRFDPSRMRFTYVPPPADGDEAAAQERTEKMDARREARQEKARQEAEWKARQGDMFRELPDGEGGDVPF